MQATNPKQALTENQFNGWFYLLIADFHGMVILKDFKEGIKP
jgi:hypothetical protein